MDKAERILLVFCRLLKHEWLNKTSLALEFNTTERTIERDMQSIRAVLSEARSPAVLLWDRQKGSYILSHYQHRPLQSMEALTILKILLGSRALRLDEMEGLVQALCVLLSPRDETEFSQLLEEELDGYHEPAHHQAIIKTQWDLQQCIRDHRKIRLHYSRGDDMRTSHVVFPLSVVVSDGYFYLIAVVEGTAHTGPAFFRLDRIRSFDVLHGGSHLPEEDAFSLRRLRSTTPFMFGGKPVRLTLRCKNRAVEALFDKIPAHTVLSWEEDTVLVEVTVSISGFFHWLLMQGDAIVIIGPEPLRQAFIQTLHRIQNAYTDIKEDCPK